MGGKCDILPKAELCGRLPEPVNFLLIAGLEQSIVDDQERVRRNALRERREFEQTRHVDDVVWRGSGALRDCGRGISL